MKKNRRDRLKKSFPPKPIKPHKRKGTLYTKTEKLVQEFPDVDALEELASVYARQRETAIISDLVASAAFYSWLKTQPIAFEDYKITWSNPMFRVVVGAFQPLDLAGSLAFGGRYNIGASQKTDFEPLAHFAPKPVLYACAQQQTALIEAGTRNPSLYKISPIRNLELWDIEKIISALKWPELASQAIQIPWSADWGLQKCPKVSQVLGVHLRSLGGDGFYCRSIKDTPDGKVIGVFGIDNSSITSLLMASPEQMNHQISFNLGNL